MGVFKFHHAPAVDADEVVVRRLFMEVRIVGGLVFPEVDFTKQIGLDQQTERAVNCGARGLRVELAGPIKQLVGGEMLVLGERRFDNSLTLPRSPQPFTADKFIEAFLNASVHGFLLASPIHAGKLKHGNRHSLVLR